MEKATSAPPIIAVSATPPLTACGGRGSSSTAIDADDGHDPRGALDRLRQRMRIGRFSADAHPLRARRVVAEVKHSANILSNPHYPEWSQG